MSGAPPGPPGTDEAAGTAAGLLAEAEAARAAQAKVARKAAAKKARWAREQPSGDQHGGAAAGSAAVGTPSLPRRSAPATRFRRFVLVLAFIGPGLIAANAGNDAGGIITYASAGAEFGYRTLFFMVLVTVALVVVQEMCSRLGVFTGKGLGALIREEFSLRVAAFALTCLIVANVGLVVSEFAGIGAALELFGVSKYLSVPISAVAIWALVLFGSYRYAERIFLGLSLVFFAYPVAALLSHPRWDTVAKQLLFPHFLGSSRFLLLGVALIGTTITPYMQLYVAAAVADKGISPEDYGYSRIDSVGGAIFGNVISVFIIIATAAATTRHRGELNSASDAAQALRPVAGSFAANLFGIGLFGASALAGAVVPLSTAYAISEAVGVERSVSRRFREAPLFLGLFTGQVAIGAAIALVTSNLVQLLLVTQVLNGLITPVILTFILIMANRRSLLGDAANGPIFKAVSTVSVALVGALSFVVLAQTVRQLLGGGG
ncbi:MAG: Nramp family divalent metal transporter [Acidimicrobiales bacterium]